MKTSTSLLVSLALGAVAYGQLRFAGVNIAGFDFGCGTDGTCNTTEVDPPLLQYGGGDGAGQMEHFVNEDGYSFFRLPVGWQWLTNNVLGGTLDPTNFAMYNELVQTCLSTGAYCEVDIHNYARWNGDIIGQGGPTNEQFAAIWSSLATVYRNESRVIFGVMNEPHDLNITLWGESVQYAVTAIREAGATSQVILLPGSNYTSSQTFIENGSAYALSKVTNPDGSYTNLVFDTHKYLDYDNSGTHVECVTNNIEEAWAPLAAWLRSVGRQTLNTETGGGNVESCAAYMCEQLTFYKENADVILGYSGWGAGSFGPNGTNYDNNTPSISQVYILSETPYVNETAAGPYYTDEYLVAACMSPRAYGSQV